MPDRDITPRDRSIRNIPLPHSLHARPGAARSTMREQEEEYDDDTSSRPPPRLKLPHRRARYWPWLVLVVLLCAVAGLLLSTVFEGATVTITPKTLAVQTPQTFLAQPGGPTGTLIYQTLTASQSASTSVAANGTQHVSRAATGVVTITNTYSTAPQALVANTRLTTAAGSIYRIKDAVTIPGETKKADGTLSPSSTTVSVYADKPGPTYNSSGAVQMNILGFKGDPRYTKFIVQSQGPLTDGFIGDEPAIAPVDLASAQTNLKRQLDQNIRSVATSQVPSGFIEVNGSLGIVYTDITQAQAPNNTVALSQQVTATLVIVRSNDLASAFAKQAVPGYSGQPVAFADLTAMTVSLAQNSASSTGPLSLLIGGTPTLVWQFDSTALQQALLGKPKSQFQSIVNSFEPAVAKAEASIRPFWKATFPSDPKKLTVTITQ